MTRVVVAGHVCVDLAPRADDFVLEPGRLSEIGSLSITVGGSVANTGRALVALGHRVVASARVGDDDLGRIAAARLADSGIGGTPILTAGSHTSYSIVLEPEGVDRSFWHHIGANALFDGTETDVDADLVHLGYPSLLPRLVEDNGAGLRSLLTRARRAGATTSLDLAVVDATDATDWRSILSSVMPLVDVVTPSADDLRSALRTPEASAADLVEQLIGWGVGIAAVSDGPRGIHLGAGAPSRLTAGGNALRALADRWGGARLHRPASPLRRQLTTNGAGDAATAGMLSAILREYSPERAATLAATTAAAVIQGDPITPPTNTDRLESVS